VTGIASDISSDAFRIVAVISVIFCSLNDYEWNVFIEMIENSFCFRSLTMDKKVVRIAYAENNSLTHCGESFFLSAQEVRTYQAIAEFTIVKIKL
jgi:hypothetical protein